jgi:hypothetical protein
LRGRAAALERRSVVDTVLKRRRLDARPIGRIYPVRNTTPDPLVIELEKIVDSGMAGFPKT